MKFIIYFLSFGLDIKKFLFLTLIFIIFTQINYISILDKFTNDVDGYNTELFLGWLNSGFRLNNDLVQGLSQMPIPELTLRTLFGTGLVKDPSSGGNASGHDTGYIQTYYSLGLIFAIIFYSTYFLFLFKQAKKYKDYLGFLLILVLIVIESKEFFIFSYTFPLFLLSFILISQNEKIDNTTTTLFHEKVRIKNY